MSDAQAEHAIATAPHFRREPWPMNARPVSRSAHVDAQRDSVGTTDFTPAPGNDGALQYGTKWGDAYGTGVTLTYSFPVAGTPGSSMATRSSTPGTP